MVKKVLAVIALLGITYSAMGQNVEAVNARLDAMAGVGAPADIGWVVGKPSYIYAWADRVQASGIIKPVEGLGESYGAIIITKSFGEQFFASLTMNDRRSMPGTFYRIAEEFGGFVENFGAMQMGKGLPNYPHLGFNLRPNKNLSIGLGTFVEHSKYDAKHDHQVAYEHSGGSAKLTYDSTTVRKYFGIGIVADARIWFGNFRLNPEFTLFLPKLDGTVESNQRTGFTAGHTVTSELTLQNMLDKAKTTGYANNLFFRGGAKLSTTINDHFWIVGLWYKNQRFELERTETRTTWDMVANPNEPDFDTTTTEKTFQFNWSDINWWLAFEQKRTDNIVFSTGYFGGLQLFTKTPIPTETEDSTLVTILHKWRFGVEGRISDFGVFDELLPRMGIIYSLSREIWANYDYLNDADSTIHNEDIHWPYSSNWNKDLADSGKGAKVCAGFGLRRGRGQFDISGEILGWKTGALIGPSAAVVSFSWNFGD